VIARDTLRATAATLIAALGLLVAVAEPAAAGAVGGCRPLSDSSRHGPLLGCRTGAPRPSPRTTRRSRPSQSAPAPDSAGTARASAIARVLATPCENTELIPEAGNLGSIRAAVLCLINRVRAENGRAPLTLNGDLERAAESHSREMVSADYFQHVSPTGETPADRIKASGYIPSPMAGYVIGENLAWGTLGLSTPQAIVAAWIASPEHLANILEGQYRETGLGIVAVVPPSLAEGEPGAIYTEDFGVILR